MRVRVPLTLVACLLHISVTSSVPGAQPSILRTWVFPARRFAACPDFDAKKSPSARE